MSLSVLLFAVLSFTSCASAGRPAPDAVQPTVNAALLGRAALVEQLDHIARNALTDERLAGLSVAVILGDHILLQKGYGYADLGLEVPATDSTTYRVLGPGIAAAVMREVEAGRLQLDDDAARLLPDFPWQGRRVTLRQLMDATSGLPDFHYLGDAHLGRRGIPKATEEVTALFAGRPFTHEPGERWQWTISGFHLAGVLLERVTGQSFRDYLSHQVIARAGLTRTYHCDDRTITPGLARPYQTSREGFRNHPFESATLYPFIATHCANATDAALIMRALRDGRLLRPETYQAMVTPHGAAKAAGPNRSSGIGMRISGEDTYQWVGVTGSLMGYSSAVLDFVDQSLTIAALSNTTGQATGRIARNLARAVLGLPLISPVIRQQDPLQPQPVGPLERRQYVGTYRTNWTGPAGPLQNWQRTFSVFDDNGRLMLQAFGDEPEPLFREAEHEFRIASWPEARFVFTIHEGQASAMAVTGPDFGMTGPRIGESHYLWSAPGP